MRTSPTHYINPSAIAITPNANNSYNDLAVYVAPNTTIKVYCPKLGIGIVDNDNYRTWQLMGKNRHLADVAQNTASTRPYTIYARLEKQNQKNGYIVFAPKQQYGGEWYDKYSYITKDGLSISFVEGIDGRTPAAVDDPTYWYVKIGEVTKADNTKQRTVTLDTGILGTEGWNTEWALNPDALPLRIDMNYMLGTILGEEWTADVRYVRWEQVLHVNAKLIEGWTGTDITRFHHWEITRNTGSDADNTWNAAHTDIRTTETDLYLAHTRGQGDDFNGMFSAIFTFTAYEKNPDYTEGSELPQYIPLISSTFSVMAEPVESYELEVSSETVTYNPQTGEYVPAIEYDEQTQTYSTDSGVTVRVRAKDADGNIFYPTNEQIKAVGLKVYYQPIDSTGAPTLLTLVNGSGTLPSAPFLAGQGVNTWLQVGGWQPKEEGDNIILTNRTITYIRFGAKGDTPINCYRWYKEGLTPVKPTANNSDEPAPASGDATGEGNVYPTDKWSATIPNRPATGEWLLWMCSSIRHGDNTRDAWSGPVCISGTKGEPGTDAEDREYIYKRLNTYPFSGTVPASINTGTIPDPEHQGQRISSNDKTKNDWVPEGWSDTAMPATSSEKYVYISIRIKESGQQWGPFSSPVLWTNWGVQGADGDGVQYLYKLFNHELSDSERDSLKPSGATFNDTTKEWECDGWDDDPLAPTEEMPFCYCSVIQRINGTWGGFGKLGLWSKWAKDGKSITKQSEEYRYAVTIDTVQPTQDGSPTGDADLSKWYESKDRVLPLWTAGRYFWTKTIITWSDDSKTNLYSSERNPNDGKAGQDIVVDGATVMKYAVSDSNAVRPTQWSDYDEIKSEIVPGKWLWSQATTNYKKADSSGSAGSSVNYNVSYIGEDGKDGRSIVRVTEYYKASNLDGSDAQHSETTPADGQESAQGWSTDPNLGNLPAAQRWNEANKYLWNYEKVEYSSAPLVERTTPQILAIWTKDGAAGKGIDSITNYYKLTNTNDAPLRPQTDGDEGWTTTPQAPGQGEYLWNYEKIAWLNPAGTTYTAVQMIGYAGLDMRENLIDNSEPQCIIDISNPWISFENNDLRFITDKHFDPLKIQDNIPLSGQMRITLTGCTFDSNATVGIYMGSNNMWPFLSVRTGITENGTYEIKRENFVIPSGHGAWDGKIYLQLKGCGTTGTAIVERVKLEVGDKCSGWCLSENDKRITKKNETPYYIKNTTGTRPEEDDPNWSDTKPTLNKGEWLFTKTVITWSDGSTTVLYTDERNPNDGEAGQDIVVDGATVMKYYVGNSNTTHPADGSSDWKDLSQITQEQGKWLWSQATTYYRKADSAAGSHDAGSSINYNVSYISKDGAAGRAVTGITEYYKATNSDTPLPKPTDDTGWSTNPNIQNWGATDKYLWNYEKIEYTESDGTKTYERTIPQILAIWTKDGAAGKGIDSITNYYKVTDDSTAPSRTDTGWSTSPMAPGQGQYLWNYEHIKWVNGTPADTYTDVQQIGYAGEDGKDAIVYKIEFTDPTFALDPNTGKNTVSIKGVVYKDNTKITNITAADFAMRFVKPDGTVRELIAGNNEFGIQDGQFVTSFGNGDKTLDGYKTFVVDYKSAGTVVTQNSLALTVYGEKGMDAISGYADYLYSKDDAGNNRPAASASQLGKIDLLSYNSSSQYRIAICEISGSSYIWKSYGASDYPDGTMFICRLDNHLYRATANGWQDEGRFKGDNAVVYKIEFTDSTFAYNPNTAKNVVDVRGVVYKIDGGNTSILTTLGTDSSLELYFLKTNPVSGQPPIQEQIPANLITISNGAFSTNSQDGASDRGEMAMLAIVKIGTGSNAKEVTRANIPRGKYGTDGVPGSRGKRGRYHYYAQPWQDNPNVSYLVNDSVAPFFDYEGEYYVYNPIGDVDGSISMHDMGTPSTSNPNWEQMQSKFKYLITEAIFGNFAHFGSAIISGDWMISQHGTLYDVSNGAHTIDATHSWGEYNINNAYTTFNPEYPNSSKNGEINFAPNYAVDMLTGTTYQKKAYIEGTLRASAFYNKIGGICSGKVYVRTSGDDVPEDDATYEEQTVNTVLDLNNNNGNTYILRGEEYDGKLVNTYYLPEPSLYEGLELNIWIKQGVMLAAMLPVGPSWTRNLYRIHFVHYQDNSYLSSFAFAGAVKATATEVENRRHFQLLKIQAIDGAWVAMIHNGLFQLLMDAQSQSGNYIRPDGRIFVKVPERASVLYHDNKAYRFTLNGESDYSQGTGIRVIQNS